MADYMNGKVLGHRGLDNGVSLMGQVFPVVTSTHAVIIRVLIPYFDSMIWPKTRNH